ncbi:GNAT family N-acetyltransferase [Nocardia vulneris]|uniref:GNAT family N-acetyltransferase n=1 Tax=Nocardia vulneris TaxID=1141657 RepID=UPI0030CB3134
MFDHSGCCQTGRMIVRLAQEQDLSAFLRLASQVEHWFGPMVNDAGFHAAVSRHIHRSAALVAHSGSDIVGGLLFGGSAPRYQVHWLVVSERERGNNIGTTLLAEATRRFVRLPGCIEVITFGADHPGAVASGARVFYERHGFLPCEEAPAGPEGGSRQVYRLAIS